MPRPVEGVPANQAAVAGGLAICAAKVLQALPARLHPDWIASLGADIAGLAGDGEALLNDVLLARFDLRWPDLSATGHPLGAVWLLPREQVMRVCAARALFACRADLARSVDAGARRRARALVGEDTFQALLGQGQDRWEASPRPGIVEADAAAGLGWSLLQEALPWRDARSHRLVRLMLPPGVPAAVPPHHAEVSSPAEHARFVQALPQLFPEHTWLFGSEPVNSMLA